MLNSCLSHKWPAGAVQRQLSASVSGDVRFRDGARGHRDSSAFCNLQPGCLEGTLTLNVDDRLPAEQQHCERRFVSPKTGISILQGRAQGSELGALQFCQVSPDGQARPKLGVLPSRSSAVHNTCTDLTCTRLFCSSRCLATIMLRLYANDMAKASTGQAMRSLVSGICRLQRSNSNRRSSWLAARMILAQRSTLTAGNKLLGSSWSSEPDRDCISRGRSGLLTH